MRDLWDRVYKSISPYLTGWVIFGGIVFGLVLLFGALGLAWLSRPAPAPVIASTPLINVIPAATITPVVPTALPQPTDEPIATAPAVPPVPEGLVIGAYVQISGTGGDGLRLRSAPGLGNSILLLGAEAEVFEVQDGPRQSDGYTWWYLVGLYDSERRGWAVANYLGVIQKP